MRSMTKPFGGDGVQGAPNWNSGQGSNEVSEFDLALNFAQKAAVKAAMRGAGVEKDVRSTLRELAGPGFTPSELERLEERMLDTATMDDARTLWVVRACAPVVI